MKLLSITLSGFRGFAHTKSFPLDADAVIVVGANGQGKTSLFDGILWALTGRVPRLKCDNSKLICLYSETGMARVELALRRPVDGEPITIVRTTEGKESQLTLKTPEVTLHGPAAEGRLIDLLWPDAALASDPREAFCSVLTRSIYLQQDHLRHFVEAATEQERFSAISELVGAGRVTELQSALEREKKAWSAATNQRVEDLRPSEDRLNRINLRLSDLTTSSQKVTSSLTTAIWNQWWLDATSLGVTSPSSDLLAREAPASLDIAIKELDNLQRSIERRIGTIASLKRDLSDLKTISSNEREPLQQLVVSLRQTHETLEAAVVAEQDRLVEERRVQAETSERMSQLRAIAALALQHLSDQCPVCAQDYDKVATSARLNKLLAQPVEHSPVGASPDTLTSLLKERSSIEKQLRGAEGELKRLEDSIANFEIRTNALRGRFRELQIDGTDNSMSVESLANSERSAQLSIQALIDLRTRGEAMALGMAQSVDAGAVSELRKEADVLQKEVAIQQLAIAQRLVTAETAQRVIEGLRDAGSTVVSQRLRDIEPIFQGIWSRIDPHPSFRTVSFLSQFSRGRGHLNTVVKDSMARAQSTEPSHVLSSSQLNALAVSLFLSLNIGLSNLPLTVSLLDDPLQSLDDINLLGLVDLFRQTKTQRQLLISTHDARFAQLLGKKLRPNSNSSKTHIVTLSAWTRQGPTVTLNEISADPEPLRLVS